MKTLKLFNKILWLINLFCGLFLLIFLSLNWKNIDVKGIIIGLYAVHLNLNQGNKFFQKE